VATNRVVLVLVGMICMGLLTGCGGGTPGSLAPVCSPDVCITATRLLQVDENTISLLFEVTAPDGTFDTANPPTFPGGLHVMLADNDGERRLIDRQFGEGEFACLAGDNIPGAEGQSTAACLLTFDYAALNNPPDRASDPMLTIYGDTFPIMILEMAWP
jgi:hypothetical protein